jgi:HK97 gp10 family phage protein
MSVVGQITLEGVEDLTHVFDSLLLREAQNLNRATVHAVASEIAKKAKSAAPVDTGVMRKGIKAKRRRALDPNNPVSEVTVDRSGFYWRFYEFGTKDQPARPFFTPAINEMRGQIRAIYKQKLYEKLAQKIKRDAKKRR